MIIGSIFFSLRNHLHLDTKTRNGINRSTVKQYVHWKFRWSRRYYIV